MLLIVVFVPRRFFKTLRLNDFKIALSKVPKRVSIHFSGFTEPFLNPQCIDMIEYAHREGYKVALFSTLVGLKSKDVARLRRCKPELTLHLPDNLGNAKIPITQTYKNTLKATLKELPVNTFYVMDERFISNERAGLCNSAPKNILRAGYFAKSFLFPSLSCCQTVMLFCAVWTLD